VLGRAIDPTGRAVFSSALQGGASRSAVAAAVVMSLESQQHIVQQFYVRYLDREPENAGFQFWVSQLETGHTVEEVESGFFGSIEYFNHFIATPAPAVVDRSALAVPGTAGQSIPTTFTLTGANSSFANEFDIFPVDDATGRIGALKPSDEGYEAAALSRAGQQVVFADGAAVGTTATFDLPAGSLLGLYIVHNHTTAQALSQNPDNLLGQRPLVYFSFQSANPDRFEHIQQTGSNQFAFEDLFGGGDLDFNDLEVRVDFAQPVQTEPPIITLTSPSPDVLTNHNVTFAGQVTDNSSGVASLQAKLDQGSFANVTFDASGNFSFTTGLALDGSADGLHTVQLVATDKAGDISAPVSTTFTLDTIPPAIQVQLDPTFNTGNDHTLAPVVTLTGTTEPNTPVVLEPNGTTTTSDSTGAFSFTGVMVGFGPNTFTAQATDQAGNLGTSQITVTRDNMPGGTTLTEGTRFNTTFQQTFTVPSQPSALEFEYDNLDFDTSAKFMIKDAFEASLTDANGNSLVLPISSSQDAFLNISEQQVTLLSPNAELHNTTVDVDLSHITPGTQATLTVRLVNNDSDTGTTVHISAPQIITASMSTPEAVTPAPAPLPPSPVDFTTLSDVTGSMTAVYGETSLHELTNVLSAGLAITNSGSYGVHGPLVAIIRNLSDPSIRVRDADGQTPDGSPYFVLTGSDLPTAQTAGSRTLAFFDPNGIQFTYDLEVLGQLNRPPVFTSQPTTEAVPGVPYVYQATATDPDKDTLTFSLLTAPTGMTVDPVNGTVTWSPQQSDLGNQAVLLQVDDGHGGSAQQQYTVSTIVAPPNRPPLFTSTPVIQANVNTAYVYQATAVDPDDNPLTFSLTDGPAGMSVGVGSGLVSWTPTVGELGVANVTLTVADGLGGTATQSYDVNVLQQPGNQPPVITSDPVTQYNVPPASNPPAGDVDPGSINLTLGDGQTSNQTVSASGLSGGPLTLGSLVTGDFGTPGQQDVYTFSLAANSLLYFDSLTDNADFEWSLRGPNSADNVSGRQFTASDGNSVQNPVLSLPAGSYTLTVLGAALSTLIAEELPAIPAVGLYSFRLSDLAAATPLTLGTVFSGSLDPGLSTNLYQFQATAGQSFYFANPVETGEEDFRDIYRLVDPYGNDALFTPTNNFAATGATFLRNDAGRLTLNATGTYTLLVEGFKQERNTVNYTLNVIPITDTTQALTLGSTVNGNFAAPGQRDSYTFNLSANSLLYFDALTNNTNFQWSLSGPPGTVISNRSFTASDAGSVSNPVLALPAGPYTLTVSATGQTPGPYAFRLSDLATATVLTPGTPFSGTLNPANSTSLYQFSAAAGQSFYFAHLSNSGGNLFDTWRLIDPYGNVLFSNGLPGDAGRLTLAAGGIYTVLVEGGIIDTGTVSYSFNVAPITDTTQALTLGNTVNATLAEPGQQDTYTFNLAANALLYFDAQTNNAGLQWSLLTPGGTAVRNRSFTATDGFFGPAHPVLGLPAGAYTLTISGTGQTAGAYAFCLSDLSTATLLTIGTPVNGTLNPANSTNLYQFSGNAGDQFLFTATGGKGNQFWRLIDPYGNVVAAISLESNIGPVTLLATGTYHLLVEGFISDTGTANYTITAQFQGNIPPAPPGGTPLTLGTTVSGNLTTASQQDQYTFTLPANALLYFDALSTDGLVGWSLSGPGGTAVSNRQFTASDAGENANAPALALPAGTYSLTIAGVDGGTGAYSFRLDDMAAATPLTPGTPVSDTLNPANSTNLYQFSGAAGQSFYFGRMSNSGTANWRLIDPYGNGRFSTNLANDGGRLTLIATGTYTVLIEGDISNTGTLSYSFEVAPITDTTQSLTLGSLSNGTLAAPGQQDLYTFTVAANALLYFDSLTNNANIQWSLTGPAGTAVKNRSFTNSDGFSTGADPALALPAGSYTLTVNAPGQNTGAYSFSLSDLSTATALTPGTPASGTLNPADSTNFYQFDASAGQSFYFAHLSGGMSNTWWRLIDPYGKVLFSTFLSIDVARMTLSAGGTYTLLVEGYIGDTGTVNYSFNVAPITDTTQSLALGSTVSAALAAPEQQDRYTFTLAANAQLYFDSLTNNASIQWSLNGPAGTAVKNRAFDNSDGFSTGADPALALPAGSYTLTVTATGQATGAYSFRLSDLATATPLTPGTAVSGTLNPANSTNFYQFNVATGQPFYFARQSGSASSAWWRLIDPYGNVLFSTFLSDDVARMTLSAAGTYTLLVEGFIGDTGTVSYSFNAAPITDPTQALTMGSAVNATLAVPGELDHYNFNLAGNTQLYFDSLTDNVNFQWSLTGPSGTVINSRVFSSSDGRFGPSNPVLVVPAGAYTLTVFGTGQTTGIYSFRLSDLTTATPFTPGTAVNGSLNPANSTSLYQFSASAGQSFYFARLSGSGGSGTQWRLIDRFGNVLFSTLLNSDAGRLTLAVAGTYTVLVEGFISDTGTVNYSFNVAPITDTTQSLALGSAVNATLAVPGEQDQYTFILAANALLYFDSLTNNSSFQWSLSGPAGSAITNRSFAQSDGIFGPANPVLALPSGAYTLTVSATGQATGAYAFNLSDLASATPLTPGTAVSGTLNPANSTNLYQLMANAGDEYAFVRLGGSGTPSAAWKLVDPYGNVLFNAGLKTSEGPLTLLATGTYYLLIEGGIADTGTGTYSFNVEFQGNVPPIFSGTPLTLGSTVDGTLSTAGQQDHYIFTLAASAQLYFDSLTNNSNIRWSLSGPAGAAVSNRSFANSDASGLSGDPVLTLPAGNYTLTVSGAGQSTGAYAFRLSDLSTAAPLTPGTAVTGALSPTNSTNFYQFSAAAAGQSFYFARLSGSGGSFGDTWRLIDPYGKMVFDQPLSQDAGRLTLSAAGTYTLLIEGAVPDTGTESYSFNVAPITDSAQALTLGDAVNATLAAPGEQDHYSFTLSANTLLYFDSLTNSNSIQWSLSGPTGTIVHNRAFSGSDGIALTNPVLPLIAGNYTLTINAPGQVTGAYSFRLSDLASAASFANNAPIGGELSPGNSTNLYQLSAQAGDSYYFESQVIPLALGSSTNTAQWRLVDPYGNILFSVNFGSDTDRVTLPATGTYTLLVEGGITNTSAMDYFFRVDQTQVEVVASDPNAPFINNTGVVSNLNAATFNVQLEGNGQAQAFDLQFVSPATGIQYGSIPVTIDTQYLYQVRAVDPAGFPLTYQLTQAPSGMQIDPGSGLITWVPTAAQVGQNPVTVRVEDSHGGADTQSFVVNVTSLTPGVIQGSVFNDENGDGSRNSTGNSPPPTSDAFQPIGTPFPGIGIDKGPAVIITIGPDGAITIKNTGQLPYDNSDDTYVGVINQANSGVALESLQLTDDKDSNASDANNGIFAFEADGINSGSFNGANASGVGNTTYEGPGTYFTDYSDPDTGKVHFEDGSGNGLQPGQETYFSLEEVVTAVTGEIVQQAAPQATEPGLAGWTVYLDQNHNGQLDPGEPSSVTDALGHYYFSNVAPGAYTVAEVSQAGFQQTAPLGDTYAAVVQSGQVVSGLDFGNQQLSTAVPRPPQITSTAPTTAAAGQTYRYDVAVSNPDDDVLDFDLTVKPDGMVVDQQTGDIVWEPTDQQVGPQNVVLRLEDNNGDVVLQSFQIQVSLESPPVITSTPPQQPAETGLPYQYQVQAQDAQNDPLTYSLIQAPAGMTIDSSSGLLSWIGPQVGPGLPAGYSLTIQVDNGRGGTDTQTYTVLVITPGFDRPPVITSHPPTKLAFGQNAFYYQVLASDPDGDPLTYSLSVAPAGMTISATGLIHWLLTEDTVGVHPVTVEVDDGRGLSATQNFTITVTWQVTNPGLTITSVPPESAGAGVLYEYDAVANDQGGFPVIWSLDTAPAGMSVNAGTGTVRWNPNLGQLGSANVVLRATDTEGGFSTQSFTIAVLSGNTPPNILSSPPTQASVGSLYTYAVKAEDPDGDSLTYSLVSAPAGMVIDTATGLVQWAPTADQIGSQPVIIDVDDGQGGGVVQGYSIVVSSTAGNQPPVINSTPVFVTTVSQLYSYQAAATDPQGESLTFSLISAPVGMTIDSTSGLVQWTPGTTQLGSNPVLLAVTDTAGEIATQNFTITVRGVNHPPMIQSTPIVTATAGAAYEYDVMAVDPDNDPLTYTLVTAPTGMTIDSLGRITWSPQIADIGSQPVDVSVSDGRGGTVSQQYTLTVSADTEPPQVILTLGANPVTLGTSDLAAVTATDNVGVTLLTLTLDGTPVPIDSMGRATLPDATAGTFTLVATASDAAGNVGTDSQTLTVIDPHVTNAPVVDLTTPADGDMVTAPTQVIGTVQDPNLVSYTLSVAPMGSDTFTTFFTGTSEVTNGVLGTFDPTMLQNDSYDLRLTATNTGGLTSVVDQTVNVADNLKLGNFTLSFTDLTVPVSGIPITVTRTYDTLNANQSEDFGFGWRLEFRDVDLRTSVASTGDEADGFYNPFQVNSHVYVTLPGGQRQGFTFQPTVAPNLAGSFLGIFDPAFVPDAGVTSSLTVAPADLRIDSDGTVYDYGTGDAYNPASPLFGGSYLLTTTAGLAYSIDAETGQLSAISDPDNNTLTFSDTGIVSSTGTSITFQRDPQGRIAAIIDPMGNRILYQYDANGNLVAVTDSNNNTTKFAYLSTPAHYLDQVIDPLGRTGERTDYDAQGRLIKIIDGAGNPVQVTYDTTDLIQTVTDQLGNTTTLEYDQRGNLLSRIDALGDVTRMTYDANNDVLTETDPLGRTTSFTYDARGNALTKTDALGNTTISMFQTFTFFTTPLAAVRGEAAPPFSRLSSLTDSVGNTTTYNLDFFGYYVSATDPEGNTESVSVDSSGNPISVTDSDGNTSQLLYDGSGNLLASIDALGNATAYTYDADGHQLTSTTTVTASNGTVNTLTTTNDYDAQGRLVSYTNAEGGVTQTEYDAVGNNSATIDTLAHRTQYLYDDKNELLETIYADGTHTETEYDPDGHVTATIDELGRRTQYMYDALGRQVETIYPDGSSTHTEYDADSEVIATIDQLGNRTEYQYNADGEQTVQTDPLGDSTTESFDADGRVITQTDPLSNTTTSVYNASGELIETNYADGTKTTKTYDADGRVLTSTNQLGQTTSYQYDADGHLTMTIDPLGNATTYTYNELGQQVRSTTTQTAADGTVRTLMTSTEYDDLGRVIAVTGPDGNLTQTQYDADGSVTATIDPLGRVTEYVYDGRKRLIETVNPDKTHTQIAYDAAGEQSATTDELGRMTAYQYDTLGRLIKTTYPDGSSTEMEYDADGKVTAHIDELGDRTQSQYDADGRVSLVTDALGDTTGYTYDAANRRTSETDALGHTTKFIYGALGQLIETEHPDGTTTKTKYDAAGEAIASTDQLGRTTQDEYDADGRLTAVIDPLGHRTEYAYDEAGDLIRQTDANGNVTIYQYDGLGHRTATLLPALPGQAPFESTTQYDADGNVVSTTDFNGNTIQFVYDVRDRLVTKDYPDGSLVTYTYTLTGEQTTVTDARGTTDYTYDDRDRLISSIQPDGTTISYVYDAAGDRTALTTRAGTTSYTFDALGRELTVTDPTGGITSYTYDAAGDLTRTALPNGVVETRSYDKLNRLTFLQDAGASGVIASYTYTLGPTGLIDEVVETTGRTIDYTYDSLDRLTEEKIIDAVFGDRTIDYTYDTVGNRLTMDDSVAGDTSYTYDAMDRMMTSTLAGQVTQYTYDKNGNLLLQMSPTDAAIYQYDFDNRLIAADTNGDGTIDERNAYDAAGNLVSQTVGAQETRFLIDTVQPYAQVVLEYSPSGAINAAYVYGNSLISQLRNGILSIYLIDGQHNTRELTNAAGTVTDQYIYDAFGRILFQNGTTVNRYLFAGQGADAATGLVYMRARYYDPLLGRFTAADPLRGLLTNPRYLQAYGYGNNDPVNQIDPSGMLFGLSDAATASAIMGILGAIEGGISDGLRGVVVGFAIGALLGFALAPEFALGEGAGLLSAGGAGPLGGGLGLGIGVPIAGSLPLLGLLGVGQGVYTAATTNDDRQRYAAIFGLFVYAASEVSTVIRLVGSVPGLFKAVGAASEVDQSVAQEVANATGTNIDLGGAPIGADGTTVINGTRTAAVINTIGMDSIAAQRFIETAEGDIVTVIFGEGTTDFELDETLAFAVRKGNNSSKIFQFYRFEGVELTPVREYGPGDPLPPFAKITQNFGISLAELELELEEMEANEGNSGSGTGK
jgi:RHS repeat-associated protein